MKRYNLFVNLDILEPASSDADVPELLGNHPNSFFAGNHSNDLHPVIQYLEQIGSRAEQLTNSVLCNQLTELMTDIELEATPTPGLN